MGSIPFIKEARILTIKYVVPTKILTLQPNGMALFVDSNRAT